MVTLVSYGVMPQRELAGISQPSMAAVLESIVGPWGSIFIRVGVIVSVLGAYLAWTLMSAEVLYIPAKAEDMPRFIARTNIHGARVSALIMAAGLISLLLVALLFAADALDFMLDLTAALSLIPYLLVAGKSYVPDVAIATVATVYTGSWCMPQESTNCWCPASCTRPPPRSTSRRAANAVCVCSDPPRPCCSA